MKNTHNPAPPPAQQQQNTNGDAPLILHCKHPQWSGFMELTGSQGRRMINSDDTAEILHHSDKKLIVKWKRWGTEKFEKKGQSYCADSLPPHAETNQPDKTEIIIKTERQPLVFLFGAPYHANMGDQAQLISIMQWLRRHKPHHGAFISTLIDTSEDLLTIIRAGIRPGDILLCHSGYHMTDLYREQKIYLRVAELFPDYPLVILPQTIHYIKKAEADNTARILNNHPDCTIFCRDRTSHAKAKKLFHQCRLILFPDLVTSMIGRTSLPPIEKKSGILLCIREDREKLIPQEQIETLRHELEKSHPTTISDTTSHFSNKHLNSNRETALHQLLHTFSQYQIIITDRFHGTLFSLIAGTPVIVLPTRDHKITSGLQWFPAHFRKHLFQASSVNQIPDLVRHILEQGTPPPLDDYFAVNYGDRLIDHLEPATNIGHRQNILQQPGTLKSDPHS